ncbi:hypothetical protein AAD001_07480 [Colwelliaceae bacterium 6471]
MLILHIFAGGLVLLFGFAALCSPKGFKLHSMAGKVFFPSMVMVSLSAVYLDFRIGDIPIMGVLSLYFATTSWLAIKHQERETGIIEIFAFLIIAIISITFFKLGWDIMYGGQSLKGTLPIEFYFVWGGVAAFAALLDLNMIIRGGLAGSHRIARHLWRMCIALLMAVLSFLDQDIFPTLIKNSGVLWLLIILPTLLMFYWLCRLLFTRNQ